MSSFSAIDVRLDLQDACNALRVPADQRALLTVRLNENVTDSEAGRLLGWNSRRLDRVAKSLQPNRAIGLALRRRLAAYKKSEKSCQASVLEIPDPAHSGV